MLNYYTAPSDPKDWNPPDETHYYLIGKDGVYLCKRTPLYELTVKPKTLPAGDVKEALTIAFVPIPRPMLVAMTDFCRKIWQKFKGEAIIMLGYHPDRGEWIWEPPIQKTKGLSVDYEANSVKFSDGFLLAGTLHSHCDVSAFQSGTDARDEINFDGIHITVGNLGKIPDYHFRLVAHESEWVVTPDQIIDDGPAAPWPVDWLERVTEQPYHTGQVGYGTWVDPTAISPIDDDAKAVEVLRCKHNKLWSEPCPDCAKAEWAKTKKNAPYIPDQKQKKHKDRDQKAWAGRTYDWGA